MFQQMEHLAVFVRRTRRERLEGLRAKICFVADNIHAIIDQSLGLAEYRRGNQKFLAI